MSWEVEYTDEFEEWWHSLIEKEQVAVDASVRLLELLGPSLKFPHSSGVKGSRHGHMRELLETEVRGRRSEVGGKGQRADIGRRTSDIWNIGGQGSGEIRRETTDGMRNTSPLQMICMTNISTN